MKKTCSTTHHNVQLISQLLTCIFSYTVEVYAFFCHYSIFWHTPKCPGSYPRMGITVLTTWCGMSSEDYCCWKVKQCLTQMQTWMIHYWIQKRIPLKYIVSYLNPFHILTSCCSKILLRPPPSIHSIGSFTVQEVELSLHENTCFDWNNYNL